MIYPISPNPKTPTNKGLNIAGSIVQREFGGLSIIPLASNNYFIVRKEPKVSSSEVIKVKKAVPGTGHIFKDPANKIWIGVDTPSGLGWVRSDVASWKGKTNNATATTSNPKANQVLTDAFEPKIKGKAVGYLASTPKVNFRKEPKVSPDNLIRVFEKSSTGKTIGELTGQMKNIEGSKVRWLQVKAGNVVGWVRSDVVYWSGAVSTTELIQAQAENAIDTVKTNIINPLLLVGLGYLVIQSGIFKSKKND